MLSFSIVINTLNRGPSLAQTLESFRWLKYGGDFEIIVVNGPSTDNSAEVIDAWKQHIRSGTCDIANLSKSRNIGIAMAQGDIVAFIDDDAIPEPEWLSHLAKGYDSPAIGGAGGLVFDQSGYTYQYEFSTASRLANANWAAGAATEHFCFPQSFDFPYLQGTNASFRRSALLEVGGFDEEIEFYLDETELCCRLVDAGFVIRQLNSAWVHHKFAPSHVRDEHKITRYRYPVIKNKIYFSLKHGREFRSVQDILEDNVKFSSAHEADIKFHIEGGRLQTSELEKFKDENARAWERGVARGMSDSFELLTQEKLDYHSGAFKKFHPVTADDTKAMIFVSRDFPPQHSGGIATFNKDLAEAAAAEGHIVHVITHSDDLNRVDFEHGVWVHRMVMKSVELSEDAAQRNIPQHIWDWSATALEEARRIATHRPIDIVEAPIWDCEGIAFLLEGDWPLVTSLQTTLRFFLDYHPELKADENWMASFGHPMIRAERALIMESDALRAISGAIRREVEQAYDCVIEDERVTVTPLGMPDAPAHTAKQDDAGLDVLFVGRLEPRKGIDTLLEAIPLVLAQHPNVRFRIIGDDSLHIPGNDITYKEDFLADEATSPCRKAVSFEGRVDNDRLFQAYEDCDVFVAPSRFESFGLIFLEAMRVGKPVIGCRAGGVPEIVSDGDNGFLTMPGNVRDLADAISQLVGSASLRERMGRRSLEIFNERFTSSKMAEHNQRLIAQVGRNAKQRARVR
tara:strand:- start:27356 stop:29578 length:2223 start_codon:yes stop_codon:yes gene_type:complete